MPFCLKRELCWESHATRILMFSSTRSTRTLCPRYRQALNKATAKNRHQMAHCHLEPPIGRHVCAPLCAAACTVVHMLQHNAVNLQPAFRPEQQIYDVKLVVESNSATTCFSHPCVLSDCIKTRCVSICSPCVVALLHVRGARVAAGPVAAAQAEQPHVAGPGPSLANVTSSLRPLAGRCRASTTSRFGS